MLVLAVYFALLAVAFAMEPARRALSLSARVETTLRLAPFAAIAVLLAIESQPHPSQLFEDFRHAYWRAPHLVFSDPAALYDGHAHGFVNLPIFALPFAPLAALDEWTAAWIWLALGLLVVGASAAGIARLAGAGGERRLAIAALFLANGPLFNSLREGNSTHFVLGLLVLALTLFERGRRAGAGAVLALAALLKPPLALLLAPFLFDRHVRVLLGAVACVLGVGLASVAIFGPELHLAWWERTVLPSTAAPFASFNVQSIDGVLARLFRGSEVMWRWAPISDLGPGFLAVRNTLLVLLVAGSLWTLWRARRRAPPWDVRIELGIVLCAALLASPISWTHYYTWLLLPLGLCLGSRPVRGERPRGTRVLLVAALLVSAPVVAAPHTPAWLEEAWAVALGSHYAYGAALLLVAFPLLRWRLD